MLQFVQKRKQSETYLFRSLGKIKTINTVMYATTFKSRDIFSTARKGKEERNIQAT